MTLSFIKSSRKALISGVIAQTLEIFFSSLLETAVVSCMIKFACVSAVNNAFFNIMIAKYLLSEQMSAPVYTNYLATELRNCSNIADV